MSTATYDLTWNTDILLATFAQVSGLASVAGAYCSDFQVSVLKAGTEIDVEAREGFNGKVKCTW